MAGLETANGAGWKKRDVKIIPSLVVGLGGTGVGAIRHLKRRVRLDWPGEGPDRMPELIQFYGIDSVSYRNGPGMEFVRPGEYGFTGGFDPQRLLREHRAIREWWDFQPGLLPPGVIHLGARQIRALGRMSLFHAFPGIWDNLSFKIERLNAINAASQVNRYGFDIPVETSARQVVIVSSICGGTGAGTFLDIAARIRQFVGTDVKIVAVLVLPSAFKHALPSSRQDDRVKANAYAALKEISAFWFAENGRRFEVRYPGAAEPHRLEHALFNEIYLVGKQGQGRSLSTLDDVVQQVAHFLYLTTMHTIADPVGEATVNLDRLRKAYSSFAVGALSLPESKITEALYERLKGQLLKNLIDDLRPQENAERLERLVRNFLVTVEKHAAQTSTDLISEGRTSKFNARATREKNEIITTSVEWLLETIIPNFGLLGVDRVKGLMRQEYQQAQVDFEKTKAVLAKVRAELENAKSLQDDPSRWNRLRKGEVRDRKIIDSDILKYQRTLAILQMLVVDGTADSEPRFLDYVLAIVESLTEQILQFRVIVRPLAADLADRSAKAIARSSKEEGRYGEGRELRYYDMEVDPSLPGLQDPASRLMKEAIEQEAMGASELYTKELLYHTLQLIGLTTADGKQRPGERQMIVGFQQVIHAESGTLLLSRIDAWSVERLAESLVRQIVNRTLKEQYSLEALLKKPDRADGQEQTDMKAALRVSVRGVLDNVRPFWGASPYPDEQQLENIRFISADFDPAKAGGTPAELFGEYLDSAKTSFDFKRGANPYRFDALWLQHGAELCHIQEVHDCWDVYRTFHDKEGLHLAARYADFPEPDGVPRMGPPVPVQWTRRWTLAERARLFESLMVYAGPVAAWDVPIRTVLTAAQQAGTQDLYEEALALITAEPELGNETFAELHYRFGASF